MGIILKLRNEHSNFVENVFRNLQETFHISFKQEKASLKKSLEILRANYQQTQVDTMAKLKPIHGFLGNQHILGTLCAEFEKKSELLSQNVKTLMDAYMVMKYYYIPQITRKQHYF